MSGTVDTFINLAEQAYHGRLKLPAFQRQFQWNRKQVVLLFDSIRQGYPLNGMIHIEGNNVDFQPREFLGAEDNAKNEEAKRLVLDGQQRLTAGIHLFFNKSDELNSQYFIDINKLSKIINENKVDIDNENQVIAFLSDLDVDSGYCIARSSVKDPYALLNRSNLIFTPLLLASRAKDRSTYFDSYLEKNPSQKKLLRNVIESHFLISSGPTIPVITIEDSFKIEAISRIFATLNSTGKVLTPFELVVSVLYPKNIDLRNSIEEGKQLTKYYPNMDATGEVALQTAVLFAGGSPKKSLLPKTLSAEIWNKYGIDAFEWLDCVGEFLTHKIGMSLDKTSSLIPYDSIFAPMAYVMREVNYPEISGEKLARVNDKLSKWVVGSALDQRYQEGVHNKQESDCKAMIEWIKDDKREPDWLRLVKIPRLTLATPTGAIGRIVRSLFNRMPLEDPVNQKAVNVGLSSAHMHHIFPTKYVSKLSGWDEKSDRSNLLLNIMQLDNETNTSFLNDDPVEQIKSAKISNSNKFSQSYAFQGIDQRCLDLMSKGNKSRGDFLEFLKIREENICKILEKFQFSKDNSGPEIGDLEDA